VLVAASVCWAVEVLGAPILTGVAVGLSLRAVAIFGEIGINSLKADELRIDLSRWVRDRDRQFGAELRGIRTSAGNQLTAGSTEDKMKGAMKNALHEYRDRASTGVRGYSSLARSEGWLHLLIRRLRKQIPRPLTITEAGHLILVTWRNVEPPVKGRPTLTLGPEEDLSLADDAEEIWPLESEPGLTWAEAGQRESA